MDHPESVVISFMKRVEDQLGSEVAIAWPDTDFDSSSETEWIRPDFLDDLPLASRLNERNERWMFQVACAVRTGRSSSVSIWRANEIAGLVDEAFGEFDLPIRNYDAIGDPIIGYLRFGPSMIDYVPERSETADLERTVVTLNGALIE